VLPVRKISQVWKTNPLLNFLGIVRFKRLTTSKFSGCIFRVYREADIQWPYSSLDPCLWHPYFLLVNNGIQHKNPGVFCCGVDCGDEAVKISLCICLFASTQTDGTRKYCSHQLYLHVYFSMACHQLRNEMPRRVHTHRNGD